MTTSAWWRRSRSMIRWVWEGSSKMAPSSKSSHSWLAPSRAAMPRTSSAHSSSKAAETMTTLWPRLAYFASVPPAWYGMSNGSGWAPTATMVSGRSTPGRSVMAAGLPVGLGDGDGQPLGREVDQRRSRVAVERPPLAGEVVAEAVEHAPHEAGHRPVAHHPSPVAPRRGADAVHQPPVVLDGVGHQLLGHPGRAGVGVAPQLRPQREVPPVDLEQGQVPLDHLPQQRD